MSDFDFEAFPTLRTPRLVLREFVPGDADDVFAMASDPEMVRYDSDPPMRERGEALAHIEEICKEYAERKSIWWAVCLESDLRVIGDVAFSFWGRVYYKADLGYALARPYWRQGIASEAVGATLRFAFETLHVHRVNVDTRMDNLASVALMRKLGFQHEGARRECVRSPDGSYQTWGLYGMLENEYFQSALRSAA
jgi:ribosomal-protein-alanine N-acetyltransferase